MGLLAWAPPAFAADGGFDSPTYQACEEWRDAGAPVQTDGGWYLPDMRLRLTNCRLASCQTALSDAPAPQPALLPVMAGAALGLAVGLATGAILAAELLKK